MSKLQVVKELHKPARKNFPRRRFIQKGLDDTWQIDLIDMQPYARENKGHKYILVCIDTFSKYAWAVPIKNKSSIETTHAMSVILNMNKRTPKNIQSDDGKEFFNREFQNLMKKHHINHYSTYSGLKASMAERFIRTLKNWIWMQFSFNGKYNWLTHLSKLMHTYNNKIHRSIRMKPALVDKKNEGQLLSSVYSHLKILASHKYQVGDFVRISKTKSVFAKGYTGNWSTEIFKIRKVQNTFPVTYLLQDEKASPILGAFYEEELSKVKYPEIYLVEKVLKRRGNQVLVKWLGLSDKSWINKKDIV